VADDRDAQIPQIFGRQARQEVAVDRVVVERRFVLPEAEILEPGRNVHGRLHSADWDNRLRPVACKASTHSGGSNSNVR
jgi:5-methylcytosine-specific restriction endonuclease McrA